MRYLVQVKKRYVNKLKSYVKENNYENMTIKICLKILIISVYINNVQLYFR